MFYGVAKFGIFLSGNEYLGPLSGFDDKAEIVALVLPISISFHVMKRMCL